MSHILSDNWRVIFKFSSVITYREETFKTGLKYCKVEVQQRDDGDDDGGEGAVKVDEEMGDRGISTGSGNDVGGVDAGGADVISRDNAANAEAK